MASQAGAKRAKERADAERGPTLTVTVDDTSYTLTPKDMTALDVRALREETGYSYNGLVRQAQRDMDIDILAAVVWLSRRIDGERDLSYAVVAAGINYGADYQISDEPPEDKPATLGDDD